MGGFRTAVQVFSSFVLVGFGIRAKVLRQSSSPKYWRIEGHGQVAFPQVLPRFSKYRRLPTYGRIPFRKNWRDSGRFQILSKYWRKSRSWRVRLPPHCGGIQEFFSGSTAGIYRLEPFRVGNLELWRVGTSASR